jgi:hypothetical protein
VKFESIEPHSSDTSGAIPHHVPPDGKPDVPWARETSFIGPDCHHLDLRRALRELSIPTSHAAGQSVGAAPSASCPPNWVTL